MNAQNHTRSSRALLRLAGSAAALGGLSIGIHIPSGDAAAQAATPEVNAWVVVRPDDSVVVRVARIDMGQGTVTGLAQLVAVEQQVVVAVGLKGRGAKRLLFTITEAVTVTVSHQLTSTRGGVDVEGVEAAEGEALLKEVAVAVA